MASALVLRILKSSSLSGPWSYGVSHHVGRVLRRLPNELALGIQDPYCEGFRTRLQDVFVQHTQHLGDDIVTRAAFVALKEVNGFC